MTNTLNATASAGSVRIVTFPNEEWVAVREEHTGKLVSVVPVPGTWTLVGAQDQYQLALEGKDIKAFFACPRCNQIGIIGSEFKPELELGDTKPSPEMFCRKCKFGFRAVLKEWDKRKMYCACYETKTRDSFDTHKEYLHAADEAEAHKFFWAQHKPHEISCLVGIAPVVGFFAKDDNARILVVEQ